MTDTTVQILDKHSLDALPQGAIVLDIDGDTLTHLGWGNWHSHSDRHGDLSTYSSEVIAQFLPGHLLNPEILTEVKDELVGAYVGDEDGLDVLPVGTVIRTVNTRPLVFERTPEGWFSPGYCTALDHDLECRVALYGAVVLAGPA